MTFTETLIDFSIFTGKVFLSLVYIAVVLVIIKALANKGREWEKDEDPPTLN